MSSAAVLSEAAFGCGLCLPLLFGIKLTRVEHLAAVLGQNHETAGQFKASFMKAHQELAPRGSPIGDFSTKKTAASLLRPKYSCLTCPEKLVTEERKAHMRKTGHIFCKYMHSKYKNLLTRVDMESRNRILYCQGCSDFVYDHALDRLRSSLPKDMAKGLTQSCCCIHVRS